MRLAYYKSYYYLVSDDSDIKYMDICFYCGYLVKIWGVNNSNLFSHSFEFLGSGSNASTFRSNLTKIIKTNNQNLINQEFFSNLEYLDVDEIRNFKLKEII